MFHSNLSSSNWFKIFWSMMRLKTNAADCIKLITGTLMAKRFYLFHSSSFGDVVPTHLNSTGSLKFSLPLGGPSQYFNVLHGTWSTRRFWVLRLNTCLQKMSPWCDIECYRVKTFRCKHPLAGHKSHAHYSDLCL